jgi:hypothetical protein
MDFSPSVLVSACQIIYLCYLLTLATVPTIYIYTYEQREREKKRDRKATNQQSSNKSAAA